MYRTTSQILLLRVQQALRLWVNWDRSGAFSNTRCCDYWNKREEHGNVIRGSDSSCCGQKPFVGGNFGVSLSEAVDGAFGIAVVEVSSYQLEMPVHSHLRWLRC